MENNLIELYFGLMRANFAKLFRWLFVLFENPFRMKKGGLLPNTAYTSHVGTWEELAPLKGEILQMKWPKELEKHKREMDDAMWRLGKKALASQESCNAPATSNAKTSPAQEPGSANMDGEKVIYQDQSRFHQILNSEMGKEFAFFDPQCDEPLDPISESNMNQMGASEFLQMICAQHGIDIHPAPRTEWDCERAARKAIRTKIHAWKGERFIQ